METLAIGIFTILEDFKIVVIFKIRTAAPITYIRPNRENEHESERLKLAQFEGYV